MINEWYTDQTSKELTPQQEEALRDVKIFGLSGSKQLAEEIASKLNKKLGDLKLNTFSDNEKSPDFQESIRGYRLYIVGSTHDDSSIVEMLLTIDAARRAGAQEVNVVIPYYGYARQDRKDNKRGGIGSRVLADCLQVTGIDSIMVVDLHASQSEASFKAEVLHLEGQAVFLPMLKENPQENRVVCSPDAGGVTRAKRFSDRLQVPLVMINKHRDKPNSIESMDLVGNVKGMHVIIVDDMVDTAGSLVKACDLLLDNGALSVCACITHGVLSGNSYEKIANSRLKTLYVSNTKPLPWAQYTYKDYFDNDGHLIGQTIDSYTNRPSNIVIVDCSPLISNVIKAISLKDSISTLLK